MCIYCVYLFVCVPVCIHAQLIGEFSGILRYHCPPYYFETDCLTDPQAKLAASKFPMILLMPLPNFPTILATGTCTNPSPPRAC